jgi:hypothetical protein
MSTPSAALELRLPLAEITPTTDPSDSARDFTFLSIASLAAVVTADDLILLPEYESYLKAAERLLGRTTRVNEPFLRAAVFQLLLRPHEELSQLLNSLQDVVRQRQIAHDARRALAEEVVQLLDSGPQASPLAARTVARILGQLMLREDEFLEPRLKALDYSGADRHDDGPITESLFTGLSHAITQVGSILRTPSRVLNIRSPAGRVNERARTLCAEAVRVGDLIRDQELSRRAAELEKQLREQAFRIVIAGEFKHGKSALFNSIAGQQVSALGEGLPTTSVVLELSYAEEPSYSGQWLDSAGLEQLRALVSEHSGSEHARRFGTVLEALVAHPLYTPGAAIDGLTALDDVAAYTSATGPFSAAVRSVSIRLPVGALRTGAVLVDTPGLNDPLEFRNRLTLEEVQRADATIVVLRADKLGTHSERHFLRTLAATTRATAVLPVVTFMDRITTKERQAEILESARSFVVEALGSATGLKLFDPIALDAAGVQRAVHEGGRIPSPWAEGFDSLLKRIETLGSDPDRDRSYVQRIESRIDSLRDEMLASCSSFAARSHDRLPTADLRARLRQQGSSFDRLTELYTQQITSRLAGVRDGLVTDQLDFEAQLDRSVEQAVVGLRAAIEGKVRELGDQYADQKRWEVLDRETAPLIIKEAFDWLNGRYTARRQRWSRELDRFAREVQKEGQQALASLQFEKSSMSEVLRHHPKGTFMLCQIDNAISRVTTVGFGAGLAVVTGAMAFGQLGALLGTATLFTGPVGWLVGGLVGGAVLFKAFGNPERRKAAFIQRKVDVGRAALEKTIEPAKLESRNHVNDSWSTFVRIAVTVYGPLIAESAAAAAEARGYSEVLQRIEDDIGRFTVALSRSAEAV